MTRGRARSFLYNPKEEYYEAKNNYHRRHGTAGKLGTTPADDSAGASKRREGWHGFSAYSSFIAASS